MYEVKCHRTLMDDITLQGIQSVNTLNTLFWPRIVRQTDTFHTPPIKKSWKPGKVGLGDPTWHRVCTWMGLHVGAEQGRRGERKACRKNVWVHLSFKKDENSSFWGLHSHIWLKSSPRRSAPTTPKSKFSTR